MTGEIKNAASEAWKDIVSSAALFVSFCGLIGSCINMANAISPRSMEGLSFTKTESK